MVLGSDFTKGVIAKALDGHWQRHGAISGNLANVETPGYKKHQIDFESQLSQAVKRHHGRNEGSGTANNDDPMPLFVSQASHFSPDANINSVDDVEPRLIIDDTVNNREDGNSVDVETEMVSLAENTQRYVAIQNMAGRMGRSLKGVLRDASQV